jgi:hypothetical protein
VFSDQFAVGSLRRRVQEFKSLKVKELKRKKDLTQRAQRKSRGNREEGVESVSES